MQSYIEQLIYAYTYEATVSFEEMEYLARMLDYLEVTLSDESYQAIACSLNQLAYHLKQESKHAIGMLSYSDAIPKQLTLNQCLPLIGPSFQFA